jgi:hypothetical protein
MVRGPEGSRPVPRSHSVRERIRRIAQNTIAEITDDVFVSNRKAQEFLQFELAITVNALCELIVRAAEDEWTLWTGTTNATPGHMGEPLYYFCPSVEGRRVLIKFELTAKDQLRVYSVHDDELPGRLR